MAFEIRLAETGEDITQCAEMMAASDPWKRLARSARECEESLRHPSIRVDAAVEGNTVIGFLASLENGIGFEPLIEYQSGRRLRPHRLLRKRTVSGRR
jgi:hypothetical protein